MADEGYVEDGLEVDAGTLNQEILDGLADALGPGWAASDAHVETALSGVIAPLIAENREVASLVLRSIFNYFVEDMLGIPIVQATPATVTVTITALDTDGHTIEAGTQFTIRNDSGIEIGFEVREEVVIEAGTDTTADGEVILDAVIPGADGSGLTGEVRAATSLQWLETVEMFDAQTTGGVDAEDRDAYHFRSSELLTLYKPAVTLAADAAKYLRLTIPGVGRALALDNYDPGNGLFTNERFLTVAVADADGAALSAGIKNECAAALEALSETDAETRIIDPTTTPIDVTLTATAYEGVDLVTADADVVAALQQYLSSARWGAGMAWGDASTAAQWLVEQTVRRSELEEHVNRVEGIHYVQSLTFRKDADAFATTDITLPGVAPLTSPGAILVTVNAP